jgi:hypothetical protein
MKLTNLFLSVLGASCLTGCAYRGAVYSEYQQFSLDIRATATSGSSAPIEVNAGYDRAVFAYIPKQNADTNSTQGEAVSLVSWNNISSSLNPSGTSSNSLLKVNAGFITGVAADIATAPTNCVVNLVAPGLTNTIQTYGGPGERLAAASTMFLSAASAADIDLVTKMTDKIGALKDANDQAGAAAILARLGIAAKPGQDPFKLLKQQVAAAALDRSKLPEVQKAFGF